MKIPDVFGRDRVLLPVIHVMDFEQARQNVEYAIRAGADGVFLINHDGSANDLVSIYHRVRRSHPKFWIGLNMLRISTRDAINLAPETVSGLWVDDAGYDEETPTPAEKLEWLSAWRRDKAKWGGLYFGGVAFKYQKEVRDLSLAAEISSQHIDVVTTSGDGTGTSPTIKKIRQIRHGLGVHPLAVASGINATNISMFLPLVECFLVSTGINSSFYRLDESKTRYLADVIHGEA